MTKYKILIHAVGPPYYVNGQMMTVGRCETHGIEVPTPCNADTLCSIGKIEQATDKALAAIDAARKACTAAEPNADRPIVRPW